VDFLILFPESLANTDDQLFSLRRLVILPVVAAAAIMTVTTPISAKSTRCLDYAMNVKLWLANRVERGMSIGEAMIRMQEGLSTWSGDDPADREEFKSASLTALTMVYSLPYDDAVARDYQDFDYAMKHLKDDNPKTTVIDPQAFADCKAGRIRWKGQTPSDSDPSLKDAN
jgi:hypothetical protein